MKKTKNRLERLPFKRERKEIKENKNRREKREKKREERKKDKKEKRYKKNSKINQFRHIFSFFHNLKMRMINHKICFQLIFRFSQLQNR